MSLNVEKKAKKRKHAAADMGQEAEPSTKRHKKEKDKSKKKDKGKGRVTEEFRVILASMFVSIPPVFANNLRQGVEEMLDSLLMRYIPALQGIVLAHDNLQFLSSTAMLKADCPFANCQIAFDATVWSPQIGMKLVGKVNLCSPDHVALLVHRTFNVSIPRHHIPTDQWEFEYGPAENDPEFGAEVVQDPVDEPSGEAAAVDGGGRWVHSLTTSKLGGDDGYLEFTVVGYVTLPCHHTNGCNSSCNSLTIANQMLSLVGSIQPDPFSPTHQHAPPTQTASSSREVSRVLAGPFDDDIAVAELDLDEGLGTDEEDTFGMLGRLGDEAAAREAEQREKEKQAAKGEKKRKRKEAVEQADGTAQKPPKEKTKRKKTS
ncbi:hypothetical protein DAEQUDRAFT_730335 [Daedalea quercina L-15889]|uniref:RPA43 OB domain-containing protein n=1 Tax=Daedalea quercina L-15889 TaxID=1314783 RepID=A0A165N0P2_9APHY|nr:hypothetical protein DAEQUDRAFT_730335 [Daedalea quercina L-15889]